MSDLISRQAAIDAAVQSIKDWDGMFIQDANCRIRDAISELPSAQPEHGRWEIYDTYKQTIDGRTFDGWCECSECRSMYPLGFSTYNYCPNCGSYNGGEQDE